MCRYMCRYLSVGDLSVDDLSVYYPSVHGLPVDDVSLGDLSVHDLSVDLSVDIHLCMICQSNMLTLTTIP